MHAARLHTGEAVVVKVIRPGIEARFRVDFFYFRRIASALSRLGILPNVDLREIVRELQKLSAEETDFRREARNLREMGDLMASDDVDHAAPRVHPDFSGRAVLTMDRIEGVPVTRLIAAVEEGDEASLAAWAEGGHHARADGARPPPLAARADLPAPRLPRGPARGQPLRAPGAAPSRGWTSA